MRALSAGRATRVSVRVRGIVQGVGFRPFVYGLARRHGLSGWVRNDSEGVLIEVEGENTKGFIDDLQREPPPLARIDAIAVTSAPPRGESDFSIVESKAHGRVCTAIGPDATVCGSCLTELFDPADRRYRYAFINCTHCGPRYTITRRLPYDRPQTSMAPFRMCAPCQAEYDEPLDRRFHAQPQACPDCGPRLSMPVEEIVRRLDIGQILAIKGIGGFHLTCDARNPNAVLRLRQLKQRDAKPFAVMVLNVESARRLAFVGREEKRLIEGVDRPIVLVRRHADGSGLAPALAPDLAWLGIMLPYTPLHYLVFHEGAGRPSGTAWLREGSDRVLVMTSANPKGEPLLTRGDDVLSQLGDVVDAVVDQDRAIVVRADDGVVRFSAGAPMIMRRARGHVPEAIPLPHEIPPVLAVGGHLKVAVCVTRGREAYLSQHIGDVDNRATMTFFEETVDHLCDILQIHPEAVAHDGHPDFLTTRYAQSLDLPSVAVQHHHSHVASVSAEHGIVEPVVGIALDGFGLGEDGGAWGGELLIVDGATATRIGSLAPLALPGGDRAAREPWRMAAAAFHALGRGAEIAQRFSAQPAAAGVADMLEKRLNTPLTSSCGRLFDAACGILGVRHLATFEGEAPMVLESLVSRPCRAEGAWAVDGNNLILLPLLERLIDSDPVAGANLFHGTLVAALIDWAYPAIAERQPPCVVLAGGCFANQVLTEGLIEGFAEKGVRAVVARHVPVNDGGISLGQAWVAGLSVSRGTAAAGGGPPPN